MGCEDHAGLRVCVCSVRGRLRAWRTGPARGEQDVQTVTQEVRQTGDVKRLCMTVKTGERIDAMSCELIDPLSGGVK